VRVKILEIDSERRRLSLSIKRVEGQELPVRPIQPADLDDVPELGLSEDVFASADAPADSAANAGDEVPTDTRVAESSSASTDSEPGAAPSGEAVEGPLSQEAPPPEEALAEEAAPESDAEAVTEDEAE
jgi:small subunit ribosomal protein S1